MCHLGDVRAVEQLQAVRMVRRTKMRQQHVNITCCHFCLSNSLERIVRSSYCVFSGSKWSATFVTELAADGSHCTCGTHCTISRWQGPHVRYLAPDLVIHVPPVQGLKTWHNTLRGSTANWATRGIMAGKRGKCEIVGHDPVEYPGCS